ncbi:MAG TPA: sialidase family protein, partial [Polyangiaceae bacterium]|nr:sialidase family protein [Polyangiaceae bacterium]
MDRSHFCVFVALLQCLASCSAPAAPTSSAGGDAGATPVAGRGNAGGGGNSGGGGTGGTGGSTAVAVAGSGGTASGGGSGAAGSSSGEPAPSPNWVNATGNLAGMASECSNMGRVAADPSSKRVIAAVAQQGLWASDDGGKSWQPLGQGAGSAAITNRPTAITFDPEHPNVFWETGIYGAGGGMYKTTDGGETFAQLGTITNSQTASVDFGDPERKAILTGTHGKGVYRSSDGGLSFVDVGTSLPGVDTLWPLLIDAQRLLMGTFDIAVYRSTDGGTNWNEVSKLPPSNYDGGFLRASDGSVYLSLSGNRGFGKSTDLGQSWTELDATGVAFAAPNFRITPIELPGGKLVTVGKDQLLKSSDGGSTWQAIGEPLPFVINS